MLSKFFKRSAPPVPTPTSAAPPAPQEPDRSADKEAWTARLQASLGDDRALLALAREAPLVDIKQAAVSALAGEASLKQAEREFRNGNQRVHRVAKQRHQALVTQRESREQASRLIESAAVLVHAPMVPANRLVELDQAWRALDASLLSDEQNAEYARLSAQLTALLRERGERRLALGRWSAKMQEALAQLDAACAAAGQQPEAGLAPAVEAVQAALAEKPAATPGSDSGDELAAAAQAAVQKATELAARLAAEAEQRRNAPPPAVEPAPAKPAKAKPVKAVPPPELAGLVDAAESALAAGHLAETRTHLMAIDAALGEGARTPLQPRIDAVQAEYARLKGWQHWGGGRVRDDLVDEAEALAKRVADADEAPGAKLPVKQHAEAIERLRERWKELDRLGAAGGKALWPRFDAALKAAYAPVAAHQAKLKAARQENLEARRQLIAGLDAIEVGNADGPATTDWREVARALEHFESEWRKLGPLEHTVPHKARDALLERRAAGVARLEAPLQEARRAAHAEREKFIARARVLGADARSRDTVAKVRELQAEWQQHAKALPLSRGAENALWAEFKAATDAVFKQRDAEHSAREAEWKANQAAREALIARLGELNEDSAPAEIERTIAAVDREWRAAGEPPRSEAGRLEEKFRAARAAASQLVAQRQQRAWQATCDALLAKLALCEELERADAAGSVAAAPSAAVAEGGEAAVGSEGVSPVGAGNDPCTNQGAAPAVGSESIPSADDGSAAAGAGGEAAALVADSEARWSALPALPGVWEQALHARFQAGLAKLAGGAASPAEGLPAEPSFDALVLQIESALDIASPPAFQSARRDLKLRAMKDALEGRQLAGAAQVDVGQLVANALGRFPTDAAQAQRLQAIVEALRTSPLGEKQKRG